MASKKQRFGGGLPRLALSLAAALVVALGLVGGIGPREALADTEYKVTFSANGNNETRTVTLPHTFWCSWESGQSELDGIIKALYSWRYGECSSENIPSVTSGGDDMVTAGMDSYNHYVTISAAFEGTATVKGRYYTGNTEDSSRWNKTSYSLDITVKKVAADPVESVTLDPNTAQTVDEGGKVSFTASVEPAGADKTVTWGVAGDAGAVALYSNEDCTAQVTLGEATDVLTVYARGESAGAATVTVTATNGTAEASDDKAASCDVTVIQPYPLLVGDVGVTSANAANIDGQGKASYDAGSNTLTLNGYAYEDTQVQYGIAYEGDGTLTISLSGASSVTAGMFGVCSLSGAAVVIAGDGSLEAAAASGSGTGIGIEVGGSLEVRGGTVAAAGRSVGINATQGVTIAGGEVSATITDNPYNSVGVRSQGAVAVEGGSLEVSGGSVGIYAEEGVSVGQGVSSVTVSGAEGAFGYGTYVKNAVAGTGWADAAGTEGEERIEVSAGGQRLAHKRVLFSAAAERHRVTVVPRPAEGGTATASPAEAAEGEAVTLTATPAEGYEFVAWSVNGEGASIDVRTSPTAKLTMGTADVWVDVSFEKAPQPGPEPTPASVTQAPKGRSLTYNGKAQALVAAGKAEGGEMQYSLDGKSWSAKVPTGTNAGSYTVRYRVKGDASHTDVAAKSVKSTIAKAKLTSIAKVADQAWTGKAVTPKPAVKSGSKALKAGTDFTYGYKDNTKAGTATVTATGKGNYAGTVKTTFKIVAATTTGRAHLQGSGWQPTKSDPDLYGTTGKSLRMEALSLSLPKGFPVKGSIQYRSHLQGKGWESKWASDGAVSGTIGESRRIEAVQIKLTGDAAKKYDVYYRVHAQNYGWMGWARNGAKAGTEGMSKRAEAVQVVLVPKGGKAPGATYRGQTRGYAKAYVAK